MWLYFSYLVHSSKQEFPGSQWHWDHPHQPVHRRDDPPCHRCPYGVYPRCFGNPVERAPVWRLQRLYPAKGEGHVLCRRLPISRSRAGIVVWSRQGVGEIVSCLQGSALRASDTLVMFVRLLSLVLPEISVTLSSSVLLMCFSVCYGWRMKIWNVFTNPYKLVWVYNSKACIFFFHYVKKIFLLFEHL